VQGSSRSQDKQLTPYSVELERTLRGPMNAQEREATRLQQLANAQARGNNQDTANNENDDVVRDEENE
ncbi:hypothetical protein HAX54_013129, partial [Datura stramonium]|nr:hypothetical protein [Datura stramonium]